jgi:hypothetical protein
MANVDSKLHTDEDELDRSSENPKRGIKGSAGGLFKGDRNSPNRTTGYRDSDSADSDKSFSLKLSHTRPTGRTSFTGSNVGIDGTRTVQGQTGVLGDHRAVDAGGDALGQDGRGTADASRDIPKPTTVETANPASAGIVSVIPGAGVIQGDLHADDVTNFDGVEYVCYKKDSADADADGVYIGKKDFDSATAANVFTGLTAGDYAVYARFIKDGALGPFSAREVVTVT